MASSARPTLGIPVKDPAFTDLGEPAVFFTKTEVQATVKFLGRAVVAKCAYGRPAFADIKSYLTQRLKISPDFVISKLNPRHLLLRFDNDEDFMKLLLQKNLYIRGFLFHFFRWTPDFSFDMDPPTVPVWIGFPDLPANLYHEECLYSIAGNFGSVLRIHDRSLSMTDTSEALVCVEMDLSAKSRERIWIDLDGTGFWQKVNYNRVPLLCSYCHKLGHSVDACKRKQGRMARSAAAQDSTVPFPKQVFRPRQSGPQPVCPMVATSNRFECLQPAEVEAAGQQDIHIQSSQVQAAEWLSADLEPSSSSGPVDLVPDSVDGPLCIKVDGGSHCALDVANSAERARTAEEFVEVDTGDPGAGRPVVLEVAGKLVAEKAREDNVWMPLAGQQQIAGGGAGKFPCAGMLTRSRARSMEDIPLEF